MVRETLEQRRARDAWKKSAHYEKEHVNIAKGLPALIMNSGLMQTMAFMHDKQDAHEKVAGDLRDWLHKRFKLPSDFNGQMEALIGAEPQKFQAITTEAFAWLKWLRQMAAARVNPGDEN